MSLSAGLLLMAAAQSSPWVDPAPTGRWAASTAKLASELLPPEMAADVVSHEVDHGMFQGGPPFAIRFTGRAAPTGDGFCARKLYHVSVSPKADGGQPQPPTSTNQVRHGSCDGLFAYVNPGASLDDAKKAILWIEWAQRRARSRFTLPFVLACQSETEGDQCDPGARATLAALPLDKIVTITKDFYRRRYWWTMTVKNSEQVQPFWRIELNATPGDSSVNMDWKIPAPF